MPVTRIAALVSGGGTNLQALMDKIDEGYLRADICAVIADRDGVYALERARLRDIPVYCIPRNACVSAERHNTDILAALRESNAGLVVLAGYLSILDEKTVSNFPNRIINVHPSLIPAFCGKGYYGERVHKAVIEYGVKYSGATVHFVDTGTDTGPIILQKATEVRDGDDHVSLAERVLEIEHELLPEAVKLITENRLVIEGRRVKILR